jgi:hypothetical protein
MILVLGENAEKLSKKFKSIKTFVDQDEPLILGWPKNKGVFPHGNFLNNPIKMKSVPFPPQIIFLGSRPQVHYYRFCLHIF